MVTRKTFKYLILALFITGFVASCKTSAHDEKFYEKQENKQIEAEQKSYDQDVKDHNKMQSKGTRKMMKDSKKQARRLNKSRER